MCGRLSKSRTELITREKVLWKYVCIKRLHHGQDVTKGYILCGTKLVKDNATNTFILISQVQSSMTYSAYLNGLRDGREVAVHLSFSWVLLQNLFKKAHTILMWFPFSFCSLRFVKIHVVQPYNSTDMVTAWKDSRFIRFPYGR